MVLYRCDGLKAGTVKPKVHRFSAASVLRQLEFRLRKLGLGLFGFRCLGFGGLGFRCLGFMGLEFAGFRVGKGL